MASQFGDQPYLHALSLQGADKAVAGAMGCHIGQAFGLHVLKEGQPDALPEVGIQQHTAPVLLLRPLPLRPEAREAFARTLVPAAEYMSPAALRDHISEILLFIVDDIESAQTPLEQITKSHGEKIKPKLPTAAELHASLRHDGGFTLSQLVSEYRALRASVVKLWFAHLDDVTHQDLWDLTRFHEAIDQALKESIDDLRRNWNIPEMCFSVF